MKKSTKREEETKNQKRIWQKRRVRSLPPCHFKTLSIMRLEFCNSIKHDDKILGFSPHQVRAGVSFFSFPIVPGRDPPVPTGLKLECASESVRQQQQCKKLLLQPESRTRRSSLFPVLSFTAISRLSPGITGLQLTERCPGCWRGKGLLAW
jgi:hypothetical protein